MDGMAWHPIVSYLFFRFHLIIIHVFEIFDGG